MLRLEKGFYLFGGSADDDEDNIRTLLNQNLPEDLLPVIPETIPRGYAGLRKVETWLEEQLPEEGQIERTPDLPGYIRSLREKDIEDTYLIVLWGGADNRDTEELVDAAQQRGIPVLDLKKGMDEIKLINDDVKTPEPEPARTARRARRSRAAAQPAAGTDDTAAAAALSEEKAPWEAAAAETSALSAVRELAGVLASAHQAYINALTGFAGEPGPGTAEPATAPEAEPARPPGTRAWVQDPKNPASYELRGRGKPSNTKKDWPVAYFTRDQEKSLGLG